MFRTMIAAALLVAIAPPAFAEVGRVKSATGAAAIERARTRVPVAPGTKVLEGDVLVTGGNGRISMTFVDNTRFSAGPNSRVAIDEFKFNRTAGTGTFVTRLDRGSLAVSSGRIAKSRRDAMKLRTPKSLLGVRGTRFVIEAK